MVLVENREADGEGASEAASVVEGLADDEKEEEKEEEEEEEKDDADAVVVPTETPEDKEEISGSAVISRQHLPIS